MSSDISRRRFAPLNDFGAVLMQQGRVLLDSDWNELIEILDRRVRAETVDIIGRGVVPKETPHGFEIAFAGGQLTIGPGRIYVDGLLAENHGAAPFEFDPVLAELRGTAALPYEKQPYLPGAGNGTAVPREGGPYLMYLDVWQREVTAIEDPGLIENAVGVDSTTRWQTVWQVRTLAKIDTNVTCATPDAQIPGWLEVIRPSAGRLTTDTMAIPATDDLCLIPPSGGYRGLENRLYRVEIHTAGGLGGGAAATFKWARHNASVATAVRQIRGEDLVLDLIGRDAELRFKTGDWVEITDDVREFSLRSGEMRRIKNVIDTTRTITIDGVLPPAEFPTDANKNTDPTRHVRIRRWEQKGQVRDTNGNLVIDLNVAGSSGVIAVPAAGTVIMLEDGITVAFSVEPAAENFRAGDFWVFTARTADASIEKLKHAPPRGVHHHYCRLGLVTFPATVVDCRVFWPPDAGRECCDCTECVTVESHQSGERTIQQAIDRVRQRGGTVCLDAGIYHIGEAPLRLDGARSVRLRGQGWKTILAHVAPGPVVVVQNSFGLTIENLTVLTAGRPAAAADLSLTNSASVAIERCWFLQAGAGELPRPAIGLGGFLVHTRLRDNVMLGAIGIGNLGTAKSGSHDVPANAGLLVTLGFSAERNQLLCARAGIDLERVSVHLGETSISGNFVSGAATAGVRLTGAVLAGAYAGSHLKVTDNTLQVAGDGIVTGTDDSTINGNNIGPASARSSGHGILLRAGLTRRGGDRGIVVGNRIRGLQGHGISITGPMGSLMIKQNVITDMRGGGIVMSSESSAENVSVENNQLIDLGGVSAAASESLQFFTGIQLVRVRNGEIASNVLDRIAIRASLIRQLTGVQILSPTRLRISGNRIENLGPPNAQLHDVTGIAVLGSFEEVVVSENCVRRGEVDQASDSSNWRALQIGHQPKPLVIGAMLMIYAKGIEAALGIATGFLRPVAAERTNVRGNMLTVYGGAPAARIVVSGPCTFCENHVRVLPDTRMPALELRATAAIVSQNFLEAARGDLPAADIITVKGPFTVVGNISSGGLRVNNAPLSSPWQQLNIVAP